MLSHHVAPERMAQAYSVHTFAGMLGGAVAPGVTLFVAAYAGWRGAFMAAGLIGALSAVVLIIQRDPPARAGGHGHEKSKQPPGWRLLISAPILLNLLFFMLLSMIGGGLNNYLVVALNEAHGTSLDLATTALSVLLFTTAGGVLLGGLILTRTTRHVAVSNVSLALTGVAAVALGLFDFGLVGLVALTAVIGLASGAMSPSRDMIVRAVTPPGAYGTVFGFVTNGFTISGVIAPLIFGLMMDHGAPRWIFFTVAISCVLCALSVVAAGRAGKATQLG
jgi:MFS family permease